MEEQKAPTYRYCESLEVSKIKLEVSTKNKDNIERIRIVTDIGELTYRPSKQKKEISEKSFFEVEQKTPDVYTFEDLENDFPVLLKLAKDCKEKPREIYTTFVEQEFYIEKEGTYVLYRFLRPKHMHTLYYAGFHKDDKMKKAQEELKKKYVEKEL